MTFIYKLFGLNLGMNEFFFVCAVMKLTNSNGIFAHNNYGSFILNFF